MTEREKDMEKEIEALRKAGRDREKDLDALNTVLQCNQDVINDLQSALREKEQVLKDVEKEREVWRQRDRALAAVLQEKEALVQCLKEEVDICHKDVEALSDSGTGQASAGNRAELAALLKDREVNGAALCQQVTKLTTALQEYQDMVQKSHHQTVSSLTAQLRDTRQELREKEKEKKEADRAWQKMREDREREERKLKNHLKKRDKLIEVKCRNLTRKWTKNSRVPPAT
uniref:protein FAM184A-like n=1 Tax=Monopterus albus TaxID=43700 RepID=UPI0009B361B6